jgi:hypothetical protein
LHDQKLSSEVGGKSACVSARVFHKSGSEKYILEMLRRKEDTRDSAHKAGAPPTTPLAPILNF